MEEMPISTPKVRGIIAFGAIVNGFGPSFYLLLGPRYDNLALRSRARA